MEVNNTAVNVTMSNDPNNNNASTTESATTGSFELPQSTLINQDVSLHQASLPSCSQDFPTLFNPELDSIGVQQPTLVRLSSCNSSNINSTFGATNLTGLFLPPPLNSTANLTTTTVLPDPFSILLEESMLDEISLLDLAMEEGFSQDQTSQLEDELDSDSGLSLDSSHSPASPSNSETSCSSAASSSSTSATFSEEGAVGYSTDSEAATAEAEEGAVGGYQPEYSKLCRMSYQDPSQFHGIPQLENVNHNHSYNLPLASSYSERSQLSASCSKKGRDKQMQQTKLQPPQECFDRQSSRDERRARTLDIPFSNEKIINLPVEEFNELLAKHHLNEDQLSLIRDIRRRGKNKMAAQNCRKRKLDTILKLEQGVQDLQREKAQLLKEKMEFCKCIRQTKQKVQSLSQELFAHLRDEEGRPYSASEYFLQYGPDGVLLMPRNMTTEQSNKPDKKQKDKKKWGTPTVALLFFAKGSTIQSISIGKGSLFLWDDTSKEKKIAPLITLPALGFLCSFLVQKFSPKSSIKAEVLYVVLISHYRKMQANGILSDAKWKNCPEREVMEDTNKMFLIERTVR